MIRYIIICDQCGRTAHWSGSPALVAKRLNQEGWMRAEKWSKGQHTTQDICLKCVVEMEEKDDSNECIGPC